MNNDHPTSSSAADLPSTANNSTSNATDGTDQTALRPEEVKTAAQKRLQTQTRKRNDFIGDLASKIDALIYMELCILYYMDCSLFRFMLRCVCQMLFLTPKPLLLSTAPVHHPYIHAIFIPNFLCTVLHILTARSEAGEAMRGYLHGGVIVDLVGQRGPTSKMHLVFLDLLVLILQCFMLVVHLEKERLTTILAAFASPVTAPAAAIAVNQPREQVVSGQDVDAEERGVMRDGVTDDDDMELRSTGAQNMAPPTPGNSNEGGERDEERERLLAEPAHRHEQEEDQPLDAFYAGQVVLADFHVLESLRKQWDDYGKASRSATGSGFSAEFAALSESRRLNSAGQRLQRQMESLGS